MYNLNLGIKIFLNLGKFGVVLRKLEMNYFIVLKIRMFVIFLKAMLEDYFLSFLFLY